MSLIGAIDNVATAGGGAGFTFNGTSDQVSLVAGTNITLSVNASTITIIGASGGGAGFTAGISGGNLAGNTGTTSNEFVLAGGNNITLSGSTAAGGMSVTVSGANTVAQTNQSLGIYGSSQTVGQSSSSTYDARSLSLVGQGIVSVGWSNSSLLISATTAQSVQTQNMVSINGSTGNISFVAGPNITLSQNASTITITGGAAGGIDMSLSGNTSGALAMISSGTAILAGGNNITLSQNGQSITISGGAGTNSFAALNMFGTIGMSNISNGNVFPFIQPGFLSFSQANLFVSINISTSATAASTNAGTISAGLSIYTRTGSTLSLASSGSQSFGWTFTSNVSNASLSSIKAFSVPINAFMTPGDYWIALTTATSSASNLGFTCSFLVGSSPGWNPIAGYLGSNSANTLAILPGWGNVTATQSTQSMQFNQILGTASAQRNNPCIVFANFTQ